MKNKKIQKGLSGLLCAALLSQSLATTAGAWYWLDGTQNLTDEERDAYYENYGTPDQEAAPDAPVAYDVPVNTFSIPDEGVALAAAPALQEGKTVVIPAGTKADEVNRLLTDALIGDGSSREWEYYCKGWVNKYDLRSNESWVLISGGTSSTKKLGITTTYTHPALADNENGTYQVRIKGGNQEFTLNKLDKEPKQDASITLNQDVTVTMPLNSDGSVNYAELERAIFDRVYAGGNPLLTSADVKIEYFATKTIWPVDHTGWVPLSGGKINTVAIADPISADLHKIKFSYAGNETYNAAEAEVQVTLELPKKTEGKINLKEGSYTAPVVYAENGGIDYAATERAILAAVVAGTEPVAGLTVTVEYDAKNVNIGDSKWKPLSHTPGTFDNTKAFGEGTWTIRFSFAGTNEYTEASVTATVEMTGRKPATINFPENATVGLTYNEDLTVNYGKLESDIRDLFTAEGIDLSGAKLEYYATAKSGSVGGLGKNWAPLTGGKVSGLDYHAMGAGEQQVRLTLPAGATYAETTVTGTVTVTDRAEADITFTPVETKLPYTQNEDGSVSVDYTELESAVRAMFTCADETVDLSGAKLEYYATAKSGSMGDVGKAWGSLKGFEGFGVGDLRIQYPAISEGTWKVRLVWGGNTQYAPTTVEGTVTVKDRDSATINFEAKEAKLTYVQNEDDSITVGNMDALVDTIRAMFTCADETVDLSGAKLEYYATAKSGSMGDVGKAWGSLKGFEGFGVGDLRIQYPAISEGTWKVRLVWGGNTQYAPTTKEVELTVTGREAIKYQLKVAPYKASMVFTPEQGYDYAATIRAIYDAVVASTDPAVDYEAVKMEYTITEDALGANFKPLDHKGATGLLDFKEGTWRIRITWPETVNYRATSVTVEVKVEDNRIPSVVVLKEGASFTYNMDYAVMRQAIFENVIDWTNSTLPEGADISAFEIKYKAQMDVLDDTVDAGKLGGFISKLPGMENVGGSIGDIAGSLGESTKAWMPIEGGKNTIGVPYAPMGAGEHQVQITFKGSAEYKPSAAAEGSVTVKKANVKVKVNSTNIRAGEALPANFITTDPADKFEFYTIYAGATSNVNLGIYLDLPAKYTNSKLLKLLDPVVEKITGKSFTQMLNDGVTLGELRKMFTNTEIIDLLEKVGVDTGAFGQIIKVVSALPSITDSVRVGFGVPNNRAGLYTATVITDNKNYNTGVGVGALLVRMNLKGVKLTWNENLGKKISAAEAKDFDFGATLSKDGDVSIDQSSVHYLYSGFTSKWKPYSSTTKAPTEPGRYTMTVVTLGGNYQAAPITRSFQITK